MKSFKRNTTSRRTSRSTKKWDVLVHAVGNLNALQYISENKMFKAPEYQINQWLLDKETKDNFGDYFNYSNNRYNVIKLLTENIDQINLLKYQKHRNEKKIKDTDIKKNENQRYSYTPAVYTTYIYSDLKFKGERPFYGINPSPILFVISSKILKDKPFISCEAMMFGSCVNISNNFYTFKKGFYGQGDLKRKPSMKELKQFLDKKIEQNEDVYFGSHEIMFDNIPLEYINAILYHDKFITYEELRKLFPEKHIKIVKLPTKYAVDRTSDDDKIIEVPDYTNYKKLLKNYI